MVLRGDAVLAIQHPDQHRCFGDDLGDLLADHAVKEIRGLFPAVNAETAGVNQQKTLAKMLTGRRHAITGDPALLVNNRHPPAEDVVE